MTTVIGTQKMNVDFFEKEIREKITYQERYFTESINAMSNEELLSDGADVEVQTLGMLSGMYTAIEAMSNAGFEGCEVLQKEICDAVTRISCHWRTVIEPLEEEYTEQEDEL